jgi:N-acetylmuramoyl-L-alanine amidase
MSRASKATAGRSFALVLLLAAAGCSGTARTGQPAPAAAAITAPPAGSAVSSDRAAAVAAPEAPAAGPLAGRTVVLNPGHNGLNGQESARANALVPAGGFRKACDTAGAATQGGYPEHAFAFEVAIRTAALLRSEGANVILTRPDDSGFGPCVDRRAAIGNAARADAVVSIHADGGPANGYGFHVIEPGLAPDKGNAGILAPSLSLALALRSAFESATGEPYATYIGRAGLVERTDLAGLNLARVPAVFIESGNMRNSADAARLVSPVWRARAARGIAAGVEAFLAG